MKFELKNKDEMIKVVNFVFENLKKSKKATILGFYGELGSGKTTFSQYFAKSLGVVESVNSPTFVIMKIYELIGQKFKHLIHIDAYRLDKSQELLHLGWSEIISNPENLVLIEWPEKVSDIVPEHIKIEFRYEALKGKENEREVEVFM